jgi:hypothetical protein
METAEEAGYDNERDRQQVAGDLLDVAGFHNKGRVASMTRTAGEVRFIKDRSNDANEWGWGSPGPSEREIDPGFEFKPKYLKPLAMTLRSALMALGHATSAHGRFVKIKSRNVSPDGNLGGKGYIAKVPEMRRQLMNCIEALSAFTDTVYDEVQAPHWDPETAGGGNRERDEVEEIMDDVGEIKDDPEGWAEEQEDEMDEDHDGKGKKAHRAKTASRAAHCEECGSPIEHTRGEGWYHTDGYGRDLDLDADHQAVPPRSLRHLRATSRVADRYLRRNQT